MKKIILTRFVWQGDEFKFNDELDTILSNLQQESEDFELIDIKLALNEGQYCALIIYKDSI